MRGKFFPHGFGTQALIGVGVIGCFCAVAVWTQAIDQLKEAATLVLAFYFVKKAMQEGMANGKGGA